MKKQKITQVEGSPPPARGAYFLLRLFGRFFRITPACAGSISTTPAKTSGLKDHPRLRGEHIVYPVPFSTVKGSPPPARGAFTPSPKNEGVIRITPACAGSIVKKANGNPTVQDHPRLRGEHP